MTVIRANCPICSQIELQPEDISLMLCGNSPQLSYYSFICPVCQMIVKEPANDRISALLQKGSVPAQVWNVPPEALEPHHGPPITLDDELDFAIELSTREDLASLALKKAS